MAFKKLVRFVDAEGGECFGDVGDQRATIGEEAEVLSGDVETGFQRTGERKKIYKVRSHPILEQLSQVLTYTAAALPTSSHTDCDMHRSQL